MDLSECVFVFPPAGDHPGNNYSYSLGSGYVIALLRAQGIDASQFHCEENLRADECAARVVALSPKLVGFTVFDTNFIACLLIAERIKALSPGVVIVFGGPTSSVHADFIMKRYVCVDVCVRNEGEEVFLDLFQRLCDNAFKVEHSSLVYTKSITYRSDGKVKSNPNANILLNKKDRSICLDAYPSPYLTGIIPPSKAATVGIITARGCNQNCTYCNCAVLSNRTFTMHSVERVVKEIDLISKTISRNETLPIYDDAFSILSSRAKQICQALIDNRIHINLHAITRCDLVDEELLDLMKEAGFVSLGFSLESAVPRILHMIGKVQPPEDVPSGSLEREERFIASLARVASYAKKVGIPRVFSSIMVGLPTETVEEANRTIDAIDAIRDIDLYMHNFLTIYRGTPLYEEHRRYDYRIKKVGRVPVFGITTYPTPQLEAFSKVRISMKSNLALFRPALVRSALRVLSMQVDAVQGRAGFKNVIILGNRISKKCALWMKECVGINANLLHIYKNKEGYAGHSKENLEVLMRNYAPSQNIHNYYLANSPGRCKLILSDSLLLKDEGSEHCVRIAGTREMVSDSSNLANEGDGKTICLDKTTEDYESVVQMLTTLAALADPFEHLCQSRPLPRFSILCMWSKSCSNCEALETAIVDEVGAVRVCWASDPDGSVTEGLSELLEKIQEVKDHANEARGCSACELRNACAKCIAQFAWFRERYCKRMSEGVRQAAELVRTFGLLGEYIGA